ncbi:MAG: HAMP domain-containing histidine kinase [Chitinophaga sp.]|uniref:sensor histidine kinase n=1 Tax=Chitinophaga sp. TaxID=1869181 RepID=UPI0025C32693|nr:HAMP domain-containing sensor histidine kinase [Chitinophaga sp.]MBV8253060.1 HAMP domain-containing histidine kinase [Chitinophaga sp.]
MLKKLRKFIYDRIMYYVNAIVGFGVFPGMPFLEVRRTKLLNLLALPCIPFMAFFAILNLIQGRYLLSALNLTTTLGSAMVLLLHHYRRYLWARLALIVTSSIVFTFTGFVYHNGSEYFLFNIMIIIVLVYDNKWVITISCLALIAAFLGIVYFPQHIPGLTPVPEGRVWINAVIALVFPMVGLTFFKYIQTDYQKEIEAQQQSLQNMNKDKEKLFSIVAHDIRSPLATLEVLLDMFLKGEYPEKDMQEAAQVLHEKVSQLGGSLDNILRWSTRSMKGIQSAPEIFPLLPLMTEVLYFFRLSLLQKNITVDMQVPESLTLYADRDQVSVILRNFLSNALKFSYAGGRVTIETHAVQDKVSIAFHDQGTGMTPKQVNELFSYNQHPEYGTNGERGTGLGLVLCREFAQQNGGSITVDSLPGKGTSLTILLPAHGPHEEEEEHFN